MRMFYCPCCGDFEILRNDEGNPYADELTIKNMVDWSIAPVQHYKCECGNYLAGYIEFVTPNDIQNNYETDEGYESFYQLGDKQQEDNILFYTDVILGFNKGGRFYNRIIHGKERDFNNYDEFAQWCYADRKRKEANGTLDENLIFNTGEAVSSMMV